MAVGKQGEGSADGHQSNEGDRSNKDGDFLFHVNVSSIICFGSSSRLSAGANGTVNQACGFIKLSSATFAASRSATPSAWTA